MLKIMERHSLKAAEIKDKYTITELLTNLGYEPAKRARNELLYLSMLRDSDTSPSFSVNDKQGTWFDFGEGKGGNIIDFALRYWMGLPFPEILEKIVQTCDGPVPSNATRANYNRQPVKKEPNYAILDVRAFGSNPAILDYLESRGVLGVAKGRLKGEHLHFGVLYRQRLINPLFFLSDLMNNLNKTNKEKTK
jgi:DNA primase